DGVVVAGGLVSPRFLTVNDDGSLYVTEAGTAGTETVPTPQGTTLPAIKRGNTGQVTRIDPGGAKTVVSGNLPSFGGAGEIYGPAGIVFSGGSILVAIGGPAQYTRSLPTPLAN